MTDDESLRPTVAGERCPNCGAAAPSAETSCRVCQSTQVAPGRTAPANFSGPSRVGHYQVLRELGSGGMGAVFEAHDERMNRRVALKVLSRHLSTATKAGTRFENEAWIAGRLDHPNIVKVFDRGSWEGLSYFSMELVEGGSLHEVIRNMKHWGRDERLNLAFGTREYVHWVVGQMIDTARALDYAHESGVVHRDVKPMNLLLGGRPPRIRIADFGLAFDVDGSRVTTEGDAMGTLAYMAPEQVLGRTKEMDRRTDVYALGATLFELLTLELPYTGESEQLYRNAVLTSQARRPSRLNDRIGRDLETVIVKCLEKSPRDRYPTAAALADDLERVLQFRPIEARRPGAAERAIKWARRKPVHAALVGVLTLALPTGALLLQRDIEARRLQRGERIGVLTGELRWAGLRQNHLMAEKLATEILELDPKHVTARRSRVVERYNRARSAESGTEAEELQRRTLEDVDALAARLPQASWPIALRAFVLDGFGRGEEATRQREAAAVLAGPERGADEYYFDGLLAFDRGDYETATELLAEAMARRPQDLEAIAVRGEAWQRLGETERAAQDYRVVLGLRPDDYPACYNLGVVLTKVGDLDEGARYLARAAELDPKRSEAFNGLAHNAALRARRAYADGDESSALSAWGEAEAMATRALDLNPDAWTHISLGAALTEQYRLTGRSDGDRLARALEHYRQALSLSEPGRPGTDPAARLSAQRNLCDATILSGGADQAVATCEEVVRLYPEDAVGHYNLAGAYALAGRLDDALRALERNVELGDRDWAYLEKDEWFRPLRKGVRFERLLARMRLP